MSRTLDEVLADHREEAAVLRKHVVYGLFDPREPHWLRYIGMTLDLTTRVREHERKAATGQQLRDAWLLSLAADGVRVGARVLEHCDNDEDARRREWAWIAALRPQGHCQYNAPTHAPRSMFDLIAARVTPDMSTEQRFGIFVA
jgi:hypothetical protein